MPGRFPVSGPDSIVFVVDDDARIREALTDLLATYDMQVATFASATDYLAFTRPDLPACLILDLELPDMHGLDLQDRIAMADHPPVVFVTGYGNIPSSVRAIRSGAVDFLTKPFAEADLMRAVRIAIAQDLDARRKASEVAVLRRRYASLTPREREVLPLIASGLLNKQSAADLGISEVTLQIHRARIMRKMQAGSLAELVRMATELGVPMTRLRRAP